MKITFDLDQFSGEHRIFNSQEEYDADSYSQAGYERYHKSRDPNKGSCYRYFTEPTQFPCLQIQGTTWDNPNGPYEINCIYIYDFVAEETE